MPPGLAIDSQKIALVFGVSAARNEDGVGGVGEAHRPAAFGEGLGELVDRAAIELACGDELVARFEQRMEHQHLRRVARGDGEPRRAAFERGDALLQHRLGGVGDAGIDVAEGLEIEQSRGVLDVVEDIGRRLIDRRRARAGGGIRLGAGMDGERVEAGLPVRGHVLLLPSVGIVDGDDLVVRADIRRARIAELLEPDIVAPFTDHQTLIILEIVLGILRQNLFLELRTDDCRVVARETSPSTVIM